MKINEMPDAIEMQIEIGNRVDPYVIPIFFIVFRVVTQVRLEI